MTVLVPVGSLGRCRTGMVDDVGEAHLFVDDDDDWLATGPGIDDTVPVRIDVGRHSGPRNDRVRSGVVAGRQRFLDIDDGNIVVPAAANDQMPKAGGHPRSSPNHFVS